MPTRLRKLKITRVAVCEQGANPDADILLFKAMEPTTTVGDFVPVSATAVLPSIVVPGRRHFSHPRPPLVLEDEPQHVSPGAVVEPPNRSSMLLSHMVMRPSGSGLAKQDGHAEPDGDETPPLDYATRSRQQDLWGCLWDKWERFRETFYAVTGDCDADNVPHLPILVDSIGQFHDDVASLLTDLGIVEKVAPLFTDLSAVSKAGAAMAGHRLTRLKAAIDALQAIFEECTPPEIEHAGISAAEAAGIPGAVNGRVPPTAPIPMTAQKGAPMAPEEKTAPGMTETVAQLEIDTLRKRAETAESRVKELEPKLTEVEHALASLQEELTVTKMSPEEQRERFLAGMSDLVKKDYLAKEERLAMLEKSNALLAEANERQSYIAKTADYRQFGMVPEQHWEILKAIDTMPEEPKDELLRLLKAATEQLRASPLFQANGIDARPPGGGNGSGSAESQIMALAQAHATEKSVGLDKAIEVIAKQHPELWARDQQEKRFSNRVNAR